MPLLPDFLRSFYSRAKFTFPHDCDKRFFVFEFGGNRRYMPTLRKTVRSSADLKRYALDRLPDAIYVSRMRRLNAKATGKKGNEPGAGGILGGDVVFDVDDKDLGGIEGSRLLAHWLCWFARMRYPDAWTWIVRSGRGFHVWAFDVWRPTALRLDDREPQFAAFLRREAHFFKDRGVKFFMDPKKREAGIFAPQFLNTRQVFRVVGSMNPNNREIVRLAACHHPYALDSNVPGGAEIPGSAGERGAAHLLPCYSVRRGRDSRAPVRGDE